MPMIELVEQFKALSSEVRLQILEWLKGNADLFGSAVIADVAEDV